MFNFSFINTPLAYNIPFFQSYTIGKTQKAAGFFLPLLSAAYLILLQSRFALTAQTTIFIT